MSALLFIVGNNGSFLNIIFKKSGFVQLNRCQALLPTETYSDTVLSCVHIEAEMLS